MEENDPVLIEQTSHQSSHNPLSESGTALCLPIRVQGKLSAFVAFGKQAHGEPYETDDCDFLSGIAHHVGALLSHALYRKNVRPRQNWRPCIDFQCFVSMT